MTRNKTNKKTNKKKIKKNKSLWKNQRPSTHQRTVMRKRCGKKCFLGTKKSFPICRKNTCMRSKAGIHAAYVRARQYHRLKIASKARKLMRGGMKLIRPDLKGLEPIYQMCENPASTVSILTVSSLKGFMVSLEVPVDASLYVNYNSKSKKFDTPVTNYLLKFTIVTPDEDESLPAYKKHRKSSESADSFTEEMKAQQNIWMKSIQGGRVEVCPPVANYGILGSNVAQEFLALPVFQQSNNNVKDLIRYFMCNIINKPTHKLGLLVMPLIDNAKTLWDYTQQASGEERQIAYAKTIAQIVRLYLQFGIIHQDLHENNALIYGSLESVLIDFGRIDEYDQTDPLFVKNNADFWKLVESSSSKSKYIQNIMEQLLHDNRLYMFQMFGEDYDRSQMTWYNDIADLDRVNALAFQYLKEYMVVRRESMLPQTMTTYKNQGLLFDTEKTVNEYEYDSPLRPQQAQVQQPELTCTISGGKPLEPEPDLRIFGGKP